MSLAQLEKQVKGLFEKADDPDTIKKYAEASAEIEKSKIEFETLEKRNVELMKALKEATLNTSFKAGEVKKERPVKKNLVNFFENYKGDK